MCLAQGHNTVTRVGIDPRTSRFGVRQSTTTTQRSFIDLLVKYLWLVYYGCWQQVHQHDSDRYTMVGQIFVVSVLRLLAMGSIT